MKKLLTILIIFCAIGTCYGQEYNRKYFKHWIDVDQDGEDSRVETLIKDQISQSIVGQHICPYTGKVVADSSKLDIDHVVPLKWAWQHGAEEWTVEKRTEFANDPINLVAVTFSSNRSKGAKGPEQWLPPNLSYVEEYVNRFVTVCDKYNLSYDKKLYYSIKKQWYKKNGVRTDRYKLEMID